ncbi:MAG TPA: hypothetical protein VEA99_08755 [Gemmatimonadaceae bacterium]|nr:hypothetical protein [Gemmatimonadaceae bacterium]
MTRRSAALEASLVAILVVATSAGAQRPPGEDDPRLFAVALQDLLSSGHGRSVAIAPRSTAQVAGALAMGRAVGAAVRDTAAVQRWFTHRDRTFAEGVDYVVFFDVVKRPADSVVVRLEIHGRTPDGTSHGGETHDVTVVRAPTGWRVVRSQLISILG